MRKPAEGIAPSAKSGASSKVAGWLIVGLVFAVALGFFGFVGYVAGGGIGRAPVVRYPPRAAPEDLCQTLRPQVVARLVPAAGPSTHHRFGLISDETSATCQVLTDRDQATTDADGELRLDLKRYGGRERAEVVRSVRARFRKDSGEKGNRTETGLGDLAYSNVDLTIGPWMPMAEVHVLRGADTMRVAYTARPADPERTRAAAVAVAREVLTRL